MGINKNFFVFYPILLKVGEVVDEFGQSKATLPYTHMLKVKPQDKFITWNNIPKEEISFYEYHLPKCVLQKK